MDTANTMDPVDKKTLLDFVPLFAAVTLFGIIGSTVRVLATWDASAPWQRRLGSMLGGMAGGWALVFGVSWMPWFADKAGVLITVAIVGAVTGNELMDLASRMLLRIIARRLREPRI